MTVFKSDSPHSKVGFLASVCDRAEARIVTAAGADIVDLKDPRRGALGALDADDIAAIVASLPSGTITSATIGDIDTAAHDVSTAVNAIAATGVDFVKVGLFPSLDKDAVIDALAPHTRAGIAIVFVFFADQLPDHEWISHWVPAAAAAGIRGLMLDTADKSRPSLNAHLEQSMLRTFVSKTRSHGMITGLAGSLACRDIAGLCALRPDYLGFRGALCRNDERRQMIDATKVDAVRATLNACNRAAARSSGRSAAPGASRVYAR